MQQQVHEEMWEDIWSLRYSGEDEEKGGGDKEKLGNMEQMMVSSRILLLEEGVICFGNPVDSMVGVEFSYGLH